MSYIYKLMFLITASIGLTGAASAHANGPVFEFYPSIHQLTLVTDVCKLEDDSEWAIDPQDQASVHYDWQAGDQILVSQNEREGSPYRYVLINQTVGQDADVNLVLAPDYYGACTVSIICIDRYYNWVWLSDGTVWDLSYFDRSITRHWEENHTIIIGNNNRNNWLSRSKPYILINVTMDDYARGECVE